MFSNSNCASVPLVANIDGNGNNGGWADGGWLWIIVVFALLFGWGNGGFGGFGGNNGGGYVATAATQADIQRGFDNSAVISKLDGISNGLCDGFYAMNNSMLTGFNGINTNIMQTGFGIQQAINADTVANMQNTNALQSQLANCCCETREARDINKKENSKDEIQRKREEFVLNMKIRKANWDLTHPKNDKPEV